MTDQFDIDQILDTCVDRLHSGDTVESCLSSFPSQAQQLAPLLQVASLLASDGAAMSAEGFAAGEARLLERAAELRAQRKEAPRSPKRGLVAGVLGSARKLAISMLVAVLLLCGVLSAGTVSASTASLPGSPLYPIKRAAEAVVTSVASTPKLRTRAHLVWADRRLDEAKKLLARDGTVDDKVLTDLEQETGKALLAAQQAGPESLTGVVAHTDHQQVVLNQLIESAPDAARPGLERALAAVAQTNTLARSALGQTPDEPSASPTPTTTPTATGTITPTATDMATPTATEQVSPRPSTTEMPSEMDQLHPPRETAPPDTTEQPPEQQTPPTTGPDSIESPDGNPTGEAESPDTGEGGGGDEGDGGFVPPGQEGGAPPPGQDDDFTPPGEDGGSSPPGQDMDKDKGKDK